MSSGIDKRWIDDDKIDHEAYRIGILNFIRFLVDKDGTAGYHSCPCRKCLNRSGQFNLDDIAVHLLDSGMDKSYGLWHYHGEHDVAIQGSGGADLEVPIDIIEEVRDDDPLVSDPITNGVMDEDFVDAGNLSEEPPPCHNHKETKYERLKRLAKRPLYPPSHNASKHSLMDALVRLNDLKTEFSLSNAAVEGMLGFLKDLLPKGNTIGPKFHEMKCTLKEVELNCVSYDVCENNCMLFWKEHINSTHCTKCGLSRYKVTYVVANGNQRRCVRNSKRKRSDVRVPKYQKVARKVMRYFPIIPRLQRLYSIRWIAEAMTWHDQAEFSKEFMRHPCDSSDWINADLIWKEFAEDPRSVRLALATDGFSPYGCFGAPYSCWPVILQPLNLPPSLTMKSEFSMLTVLIPGPHSPKASMDVFLQPLIEDLNTLWAGVDDTWDAMKMEPFKLKAMLLWCIHDFPAYGMLSGCVTQGKFACPICSADTRCQYLNKSRKCCFLYSRMFLAMSHCFRNDTSKFTFNGLVEHSFPPRKLEGFEVEGITSTIGDLAGSLSQYDDDLDEDDNLICTKGFKRRSGLFDLPYWKDLPTRHNLDLMHIKKNVTENLLNTILTMNGTKDTLKAREDLEEMGLKRNLWLTDQGKMPEKLAPFVLSKEDKVHFLSSLKTLRVPSGFSANFANSVNVVKKTFHFKSHDYHMIMQHLLPMLLMHAFAPADKPLYKAIQRISIFFNLLCAKVISQAHLTKAKRALTEALCVLERYFPPSFFVIMIHLMHHLGDEALVAGPPRFRSMWTFEREMKRYKTWARNKRYIEGSIAEAYLLHEASLYAMEYVSVTGKGTHKRNRDSLFDEEEENVERHIGKVEQVVLNTTQFVQARKWVLQQQPDYEEWRRKYELTGRQTPNSTWKYAVDDFIIWLGKEAEATKNIEMMRIVEGPHYIVESYKKYHSNGYTYSTIAYDGNKHVQNSGVSMKAYNFHGVLTTYYGVIKGIFDMNYHESTIVVFYCDWVSSEDRNAFRVDPLSKLVMVNLKRTMSSDDVHAEPFILASQASQVFYCNDSKMDGWSVVLPSPKRLTKAVDALKVDQSMYNSILEENERLCGLLDPIDG